MNKRRILIVFLVLLGFEMSYARTVHRYVIKKPGEATSTKGDHQLSKLNEPYAEVMDEQILAQEQFYHIKMLELEGRQPYQENRKTTITRTY